MALASTAAPGVFSSMRPALARMTGSAPPKYSDPSSAMPSPRSAGVDSEAGVTSALAPSEAMVKRPPARSRESSTSIVKVPGTYQGRASRADLMSRMRIQMLSSVATVFTRRESVSSHGSGEYSADSAKVTRSEEHTSELQSRGQPVCRLLLVYNIHDNDEK